MRNSSAKLVPKEKKLNFYKDCGSWLSHDAWHNLKQKKCTHIIAVQKSIDDKFRPRIPSRRNNPQASSRSHNIHSITA